MRFSKKAKDRDGVQRTDLTPEGTIKYINMHLQYLFPENSPISGDEGVDGLERKTENLLEAFVTIRIVITPVFKKGCAISIYEKKLSKLSTNN